MRLLFCCESYPPVRGGVQEVMRQIAERMVRAGHEVVVATTHVPERDFSVLNGVRIEGFKVAGNLARGLKGDVASYRNFVVNAGADTVLIKAAQQWTFDALWPVLDRIDARKVFIPCGFSGLFEPIYAAYYRQIPEVLRKFDHLIFYAQSYRDIDFARAHGITDFSFVPNGADETEFESPGDPEIRARLGLSADDFVFLTVGSPIVGKGHRKVAEAFARLEIGSRRAVLILNGRHSPDLLRPANFAWARRLAARLRSVWRPAGHADPRVEWKELRRSIAQANVQANKRVLQTDLTRGELVDAFKAADLFVFASNVEYSPLVLFEAAAAGTPFLSVPVGNAEEIARWTGGGIICPADKDRRGYIRVDSRVLAEEMRRCMNDASLLAGLGKAGKENWRARFTWKKIARDYEAILCRRVPAATEGEKVSPSGTPGFLAKAAGLS